MNSLVYRRKLNGKLRICLDPKDLNKAIFREHHMIPTLEEILPKLSGAKYFSIVDAKCGYWNVVLDQESSYITTFNLPFGRYRFLLVPFGPTPAFSVMCIGDIFQPSFNMPSFDMPCRQLKDRLTVKLAMFPVISRTN